MRKTRIVLEQTEFNGETQYRVVSLTNRTTPKIGEELKEKDVDALLLRDNQVQVDIKPWSKFA